jgi:hypothetical protein
MSTFQYSNRSEIIDDGRPGRPVSEPASPSGSPPTPTSADDAVPELDPSEFDLSAMDGYEMVSVDDVEYLQASLSELADLLATTSRGLRQLGTSPGKLSIGGLGEG